ncbi:hypothetical protein [Streptomyces sp. Tue6028]
MAIRPSTTWRDEATRNADSRELYAPGMLQATENALTAFEEEAQCAPGF